MIGDKIRERRLQLGMTQEELANIMGFKSKTTVNKVELNINDVNQKRIKQYANALKTTPAYLMGWEDDLKIIEEQIIYPGRPCDSMMPLIDDLTHEEVEAITKYIEFIKSQRR